MTFGDNKFINIGSDRVHAIYNQDKIVWGYVNGTIDNFESGIGGWQKAPSDTAMYVESFEGGLVLKCTSPHSATVRNAYLYIDVPVGAKMKLEYDCYQVYNGGTFEVRDGHSLSGAVLSPRQTVPAVNTWGHFVYNFTTTSDKITIRWLGTWSAHQKFDNITLREIT